MGKHRVRKYLYEDPFPPLVAPKKPILDLWVDFHDYDRTCRKIEQASDIELDVMVDDYFKYHDKLYGIDYTDGIDLNYESKALKLMIRAYYDKNYRLMKRLIEHGVTLQRSYSDDDNQYPYPLVSLALDEPFDFEMVRFLIAEGASLQTYDISLAFYFADLEQFKWLVEHANFFDRVFKDILIHFEYSDVAYIREKVKILLDKGANPCFNMIKHYGYNPIFGEDPTELADSLGNVYIEFGIGTRMTEAEIVAMLKQHKNDCDLESSSLMHDIIYRVHERRQKLKDVINLNIPQPIAQEIIPLVF